MQLGYKVISQQIIPNGYFKNINDEALQVGTFTGSSLRYVTPGTLLKFSAIAGKHFMADDRYFNDWKCRSSSSFI